MNTGLIYPEFSFEITDHGTLAGIFLLFDIKHE